MGDTGGFDPRQALERLLSSRPEMAAALDQVWRAVERGFPGPALASWLGACARLHRSAYGSICLPAYLNAAPACAALVGPEGAIALAQAAEIVGARAGGRAALALLLAAPKAAHRLADGPDFREWLRIVDQLAELAPESVALVLDRIDAVLDQADLRGFEAWALGGVRAAGGDVDRRRRLLGLEAPRAQARPASGGTVDVAFSSVERRLLAYLRALWRLRPAIRSAAATAAELPRRVSFEGGIIRMPEMFRGYVGAEAVALFRAALAHVAAHFVFTPRKFAVGGLKPVQIALVSLIEDARVEQLAMRELPGLRRLWQPFHIAASSGAATAPGLMARLARALIEPNIADDNDWVCKGRDLFFAEVGRWDDPAISRTIGSRLGNDLGQMRLQFNARTYVVEPPYRDDNLGLWDFGAAAEAATAELIPESVRFEQVDDDMRPPDRKRDLPDGADVAPNRAAPVAAGAADDERGIPVARYAEWDHAIGRERPDWTTVIEFPVTAGDARSIDAILDHHAPVVRRVTALIRAAKVSRPARLRRQPEGEQLDLDACIAAAISRRHGEAPDPRIYATLVRKHRDLSVLLLLDVSQSTNDRVRGTGRSVLALEREAAALLAHAMSGLGDPFAVHAFCSDGRDEVRYYRVKDFDTPYVDAKARLAGLSGQLSTRMGAALRHAGRDLSRQATYRRLLLVVTDGDPSDIDVGDRRYLVEDARKAAQSLAHAGIDVFGIGLDSGGDSYLTRIFGLRNAVKIARIEQLPEKLPLLYLRMTA